MCVRGIVVDPCAPLRCERPKRRRVPGVSGSRSFQLNGLRNSDISAYNASYSDVPTCRVVDVETASVYLGVVCVGEEFSSVLGELWWINGLRERRHEDSDGRNWNRGQR